MQSGNSFEIMRQSEASTAIARTKRNSLSTLAGNSNESRQRYSQSKLHYRCTENKTTVLDRLRKTGNDRRSFRATSERRRRRSAIGETSRTSCAARAPPPHAASWLLPAWWGGAGSSRWSAFWSARDQVRWGRRPPWLAAGAGATARVRAHGPSPAIGGARTVTWRPRPLRRPLYTTDRVFSFNTYSCGL